MTVSIIGENENPQSDDVNRRKDDEVRDGSVKSSTKVEPGPANPFDPESLRLPSVDSFSVEKVLTTVPCDKPNSHQFVRVHPDKSFRIETCIFKDKIQGDRYLISPILWPEYTQDISPVCLFTSVTRNGDVFFWPVNLPGSDGRTNTWNESSMAAAMIAVDRWVRVASNIQASRYDVHEAKGNLPDPMWPEMALPELLKLCFGNRFIDSHDHPILKSLRGES